MTTRTRWTFASLTMVLVGVAGCASPTFDLTRHDGVATFPPTPPEHVAILFHEPSEAFVELAHIIARHWPQSDRQALYDRLRTEAAGLGADAVVVRGVAYHVQQTGSTHELTYAGKSPDVGRGPTASVSDDVVAAVIHYEPRR